MYTFDSAGLWSFDTARNVIIFGVDNSSLPHADNRKNNFLVLGEGPTFKINGSFGSPEKTFSINLSKANTKFYLSLHYNADNTYLFVIFKKFLIILKLNFKKFLNLKLTVKMLTFQLNFISEVYLMDLVLLSLEKYL